MSPKFNNNYSTFYRRFQKCQFQRLSAVEEMLDPLHDLEKEIHWRDPRRQIKKALVYFVIGSVGKLWDTHAYYNYTIFFCNTSIKSTSIVRSFEIMCVKFNGLRICAYMATLSAQLKKTDSRNMYVDLQICE